MTMALKTSNIFVNVPVKNLEASKLFFEKVGFEFNPQFTDEKAACMVLGDNIFVMLLVESYFRSFINKEIADASSTTEVILAISADSREHVDEIVNRAFAAGAKEYNDPTDHGFMYAWSFEDLDGHLWEITYMDPSSYQ